MTMIERDLDTAQATIHQLVRDCSALQVEKHHMRAEIDRLTRAVEEAASEVDRLRAMIPAGTAAAYEEERAALDIEHAKRCPNGPACPYYAVR